MKTYIKPKTSVSDIEFADIMSTLAVSGEHDGAFRAKEREDDCVSETGEGTDLWGDIW